MKRQFRQAAKSTGARLRSGTAAREVSTNLSGPNRADVARFHLPPSTHPTALPQLADSIALRDLGVHIPADTRTTLFEAGFRTGLATNTLTRFQASYRRGFLWAKVFWRKVAPRPRLAARGSGVFKHRSVWG